MPSKKVQPPAPLQSEGEKHIKQLEADMYAAIGQQAALEAQLSEMIANGAPQHEIADVITAKRQAASDAARLGREINNSYAARNLSMFLDRQEELFETKEARDEARHVEQTRLAVEGQAEIKKLAEGHTILIGRVDSVEEGLNEVREDVAQTRGDVGTLKDDMQAVKVRLGSVETTQKRHSEALERISRQVANIQTLVTYGKMTDKDNPPPPEILAIIEQMDADKQ